MPSPPPPSPLAARVLSSPGYASIADSILSFLDWRSLLSASATCTQLNNLVSSSSYLQLVLRYHYHGISRGTRVLSGGTSAEELARVIDTARRWATMTAVSYDVLNFPTMSCWAVTDGLLIATHDHRDDNDEVDPLKFTSWTIHDHSGNTTTYTIPFAASDMSVSRADNVISVSRVDVYDDPPVVKVQYTVHHYVLEPPGVAPGSTVEAVPYVGDDGSPSTTSHGSEFERNSTMTQDHFADLVANANCLLEHIPGGILKIDMKWVETRVVAVDWRTGEVLQRLGVVHEHQLMRVLNRTDAVLYGSHQMDPSSTAVLRSQFKGGEQQGENEVVTSPGMQSSDPRFDFNFGLNYEMAEFDTAYDCDDPDSRVLMTLPGYAPRNPDDTYYHWCHEATLLARNDHRELRWLRHSPICAVIGLRTFAFDPHELDDDECSSYELRVCDWRQHASRRLHASPLGSRQPQVWTELDSSERGAAPGPIDPETVVLSNVSPLPDGGKGCPLKATMTVGSTLGDTLYGALADEGHLYLAFNVASENTLKIVRISFM